MSEGKNEFEEELTSKDEMLDTPQEETITKVTGMYREWFLGLCFVCNFRKSSSVIRRWFKTSTT